MTPIDLQETQSLLATIFSGDSTYYRVGSLTAFEMTTFKDDDVPHHFLVLHDPWRGFYTSHLRLKMNLELESDDLFTQHILNMLKLKDKLITVNRIFEGRTLTLPEITLTEMQDGVRMIFPYFLKARSVWRRHLKTNIPLEVDVYGMLGSLMQDFKPSYFKNEMLLVMLQPASIKIKTRIGDSSRSFKCAWEDLTFEKVKKKPPFQMEVGGFSISKPLV
jgi:hypothetical protein